MSDLIKKLDQITSETSAALVDLLPHLTRQTYVAWLNSLYHATYDAQSLLSSAAVRVPFSDVQDALRHLSEDEEPHYQMAEADMATFGAKPSAEPPPEVAAYLAHLNSISGLDFLASLYVIESTAPTVGKDVRRHLERLELRPDQTTFLLEHIGADVNHQAIVRSLCEKYGPQGGDSMVESGRKTIHLWMDVHMTAIRGQKSDAVGS